MRRGICLPRPEISIHALREEGDFLTSAASRTLDISIHALREEGDDLPAGEQAAAMGFLSTPSVRRATVHRQHQDGAYHISIHALREEGD